MVLEHALRRSFCHGLAVEKYCKKSVAIDLLKQKKYADVFCFLKDQCQCWREQCRNHQWFDCLFDCFGDWNCSTINSWNNLRWLFQSSGHLASNSNSNQVFCVIDAPRHRLVWHRERQIEFHRTNLWVRLPQFNWIPMNSIALFFCRDIEKIKAGIGEQVSHFLNLTAGFIICVILSFIYGWELTLIVISYIPILCAMNLVIAKVSAHCTLIAFLEFTWMFFFLRT